MLVELIEPLTFIDHRVVVQIRCDGGSLMELTAEVVRRAVSEGGSLLLALRVTGSARAQERRRRIGAGIVRDYGRRLRPSRAKAPAPRTSAQVKGELRALGSRMLELALAEPDAHAPRAITHWVAELAGELGQEESLQQRTNRRLLRDIADLQRMTGGDLAIGA